MKGTKRKILRLGWRPEDVPIKVLLTRYLECIEQNKCASILLVVNKLWITNIRNMRYLKKSGATFDQALMSCILFMRHEHVHTKYQYQKLKWFKKLLVFHPEYKSIQHNLHQNWPCRQIILVAHFKKSWLHPWALCHGADIWIYTSKINLSFISYDLLNSNAFIFGMYILGIMLCTMFWINWNI